MSSKQITWKDLEVLAERGNDIRALCNRLYDAWGLNLDDRRPGIAYVDDQGHPVTNLDLAVFLSALVSNRAMVNLPVYKAMRAATKREGEWVTSKEGRHGQLTGMSSNAAVGSFGFRFNDLNVVQAEEGKEPKAGLPRVMNLVGIDGKWYGGWKEGMEILPHGLPKDVFESLTTAAKTLKFQYFIHPNRWPSLYGVYYAIAKAAIVRLADERKALGKRIGELREKLEIPKKEWAKSHTVGSDKKEKVWAYEAELEGFDLKGAYTYEKCEETKAEWERLTDLNKRFGELLGQFRFLVRASEYAFRFHAIQPNVEDSQLKDWFAGKLDVQPRLPVWIKNRKEGNTWELGYKQTGKQKKWIKLNVQEDLAIIFRLWEKTERVAE